MSMEMVWKEACDKSAADRWGNQFVQELGGLISTKKKKNLNQKTKHTPNQPNLNPLKSPGI